MSTQLVKIAKDRCLNAIRKTKKKKRIGVQKRSRDRKDDQDLPSVVLRESTFARYRPPAHDDAISCCKKKENAYH
jgi:hypothetical protein